MRQWISDRGLAIAFVGFFLATWILQLWAQAAQWLDEQHPLQSQLQTLHWWDSLRFADFWESFWQSTLENWQSEFLQLSAFTIFAAYLVYKGSSESKDSDARIEAKLDALLGDDRRASLEATLPRKYSRTR